MPSSPIWTMPRIATLLSALLVSLSSGTNYVYSAYAPQLGSRLNISHTKLNIIGLAGNVGVYSSGPVWGHLVDSRGPRPLLICAFLFLLAGYSGIRYIYDTSVPVATHENAYERLRRASETISDVTFYFLILFGFLTGAGSNGGLMSVINVTAKTFPDSTRATATGIVISGFGLSALAFSTVAHLAYPDDTSEFLLLLSLGTSIPMIFGFFTVRPVRLSDADNRTAAEHDTAEEGYYRVAGSAGVDPSPLYEHEHANASQVHLLAEETPPEHPTLHSHTSSYAVPQVGNAVELSPTRSLSPTYRGRSRASGRQSFASASRHLENASVNLHGRQMFASLNFWVLFTVMSLLTGTGLMWINNVGSISQALYAKGNPSYDRSASARWQAAQVSTVSFCNFTGRLLIGLLADVVKSRLELPRSYCVCLIAAGFILSQIVAASITDVHDLWKASAILGVAYGSLFGLFPTVTIDWFGLTHFSENWGFLSMSPLIGGNLFSIAFGRNLDAHAAPDAEDTARALLARAGVGSTRQCFEGRGCYITSLQMTMAACSLALVLSVWTAWRDRKGIMLKSRAEEEVVWDHEEDE